MSRIKEVSHEVLIAQDGIVQVDQLLLEDLKARADRSPKRRARLCAHKSPEDRLHEMLIVLSKGVYIRPHKHFNKIESFHVIEGAAVVIFFTESGEVEEIFNMGDAASGKQFYFRNEDARYHTQIVTSEHLVFHEVTNGPFNRADTAFAAWAPDENDVSSVKNFMNRLKEQVSSRTGLV